MQMPLKKKDSKLKLKLQKRLLLKLKLNNWLPSKKLPKKPLKLLELKKKPLLPPPKLNRIDKKLK